MSSEGKNTKFYACRKHKYKNVNYTNSLSLFRTISKLVVHSPFKIDICSEFAWLLSLRINIKKKMWRQQGWPNGWRSSKTYMNSQWRASQFIQAAVTKQSNFRKITVFWLFKEDYLSTMIFRLLWIFSFLQDPRANSSELSSAQWCCLPCVLSFHLLLPKCTLPILQMKQYQNIINVFNRPFLFSLIIKKLNNFNCWKK